MNNLNRTQSGKYKLVDAYDLQDILNGNYEILSNYSAICNKENIVKINDYLYNRVLNGMKIRVESNYDYIYLVHNEELVGIYEKDPTYSQENKSYKAKRVWN
jgi:tRNA U55 pseudouridine synthase TruB